MPRTSTFQVRVNDEERRIFKAVAEKLQRDESDLIRRLVGAVAEQIGVTSVGGIPLDGVTVAPKRPTGQR